MDQKIEIFINNVLDGLVIDNHLRKRIAQDLRSHISEASLNQTEDEVLNRMGDPAKVAREFMDSIYEDKSEVIERLVRERLRVNQLLADYFEYRSKFGILGLPLIHIKYRRHLKAKPATAKGVIAFGNRAIGVIAVGHYCCGGICFGMFPIGVAAFGLVSTGLFTFGSLAIGVLALGGFTFGLAAFGGFSFGLIAGGGVARGVVAMGGHVVGKFIPTGILASSDQIKALIREAYPHLSDWVLNILAFFKFFYT